MGGNAPEPGASLGMGGAGGSSRVPLAPPDRPQPAGEREAGCVHVCVCVFRGALPNAPTIWVQKRCKRCREMRLGGEGGRSWGAQGGPGECGVPPHALQHPDPVAALPRTRSAARCAAGAAASGGRRRPRPCPLRTRPLPWCSGPARPSAPRASARHARPRPGACNPASGDARRSKRGHLPRGARWLRVRARALEGRSRRGGACRFLAPCIG